LDAQSDIDALVSRLSALKVPQVLCHGDDCPANCLRLIDWEQADLADSLLDIAVADVNIGIEEAKATFHLEHYLQREPSPQELFRLHDYIALDCFA